MFHLSIRSPRLLSMLRLMSLMACGSTALAPSAQGAIYRYPRNGVMHITNRKPPASFRAQLWIQDPPSSSRQGIGKGGGAAARDPHVDLWIRQAAATYHIPSGLIHAVIQAESSYNPRAVSPKGARGLMQLMPATAARMEVQEIHAPRDNIFGGVRYLRLLANLFHESLPLTLAAYHAGENAVLRYGGIPPYRETQQYVQHVMRLYLTASASHSPPR